MTDHTIRFQHPAPDARPGGASVLELDGHDIASGVEAIHIDHGALGNVVPHVKLLLSVRHLDVTTTAGVVVDDDTATVLRRLGWTPPADDDADVLMAIGIVLSGAGATPDELDTLPAAILAAIRGAR